MKTLQDSVAAEAALVDVAAMEVAVRAQTDHGHNYQPVVEAF